LNNLPTTHNPQLTTLNPPPPNSLPLPSETEIMKSDRRRGGKPSTGKSGWKKPDGTPLRKRKGEFFPDEEIDRLKKKHSRSGEGGFDRKPSSDKPVRDRNEENDGKSRKFDSREPRPSRTDKDRGEKRSYDKSDRPRGDRDRNDDSRPRKFDSRSENDRREKRSFDKSDRPRGDRERNDDSRPRKFDSRSDNDRREKRSFDKSDHPRGDRDRNDDSRPRKFESRPDNDRREKRSFDKSDRPRGDRDRNDDSRPRKFESRPDNDRREKRSFDKSDRPRGDRRGDSSGFGKKSFRPGSGGRSFKSSKTVSSADGTIRLNRYIANAGICSRREADDLITAGVISINGEIVTELGTKVQPGDVVKFHEQTLRAEKNVYVLLNKPKDYITTTDDPGERKTVMNLVRDACRERIFPVGRLDRNTTGLLLLTNDGDLTRKLTHPSSNIKKLYQVELDRNLEFADMEKTVEGVELEDGVAMFDEIQYASPDDKKVIGVELHSGKNRIVRRVFEALGYQVRKLDRTIFAGLTKKDLPRGRWRMLTEAEVNTLKMLKK
jgi:23S rRNA pseudouridine2605 synthase